MASPDVPHPDHDVARAASAASPTGQSSVRAYSPIRILSTDWAIAHWQYLVVGAITLLAALLRLWDVTDNPRGFFADEAAVGVLADRILHSGKDQYGEFLPVFFRNFGDYKLPFVVYADVPFVALLGRTELAVRGMVAVSGSLTVITTYLMAKEMFRHEMPAVLSAVALAIMPWHIHYSRTGFGETVMLLLFLTLALYLFLRAVRLERSIMPAVIVLGLSLYTYRSAWVVEPPLLLLILVLYRQELLRDRAMLLKSGLVLFAFCVPIIRQVLSDEGDRSTQAWIFSVDSEKSTLSLFWQFYRSYFTTDFLFTLGDNGFITRHFLPQQGMIYWFMLPLVVLGLIATAVKRERALYIVVALLFLFPLGGALSESSPHSLRALLGALPYALLSGLGLWFAVEQFTKLTGRPMAEVAYVTLTVAGLAAAFALGGYLRHYHNDYPRLSADFWGWQDGPQAIVQRFMDERDNYDQLVMDGAFNAPDVFLEFYGGDACKPPRCIVGDSNAYKPSTRQLFALRLESLKPAEYDYVTKGELHYPDGKVSFVFVEIARKR